MSNMAPQDKQQIGLVSLVVTMIMMIVVSLLVLGFAQIARNEQRNTIDDELSAQAYYAAESGINDARAVISKAINTPPAIVQPKTLCPPDANYPALSVVDASKNVEYSCLLVIPSAKLYYDVGTSSTVIPLVTAPASPGIITLTWDLAGSTAGCSAVPTNNLPVSIAWTCGYPLLRVDLVDAGPGISRATLLAGTTTMFLMPVMSGAGGAVSFGVQGAIVPAACNAATCTVQINGFGAQKYLYMRVKTMYGPKTHLTVSESGNKIRPTQAIIDATGRAQDVLRRIRVGIDFTNANQFTVPSAAITTRDSICKRFGSTDNSFKVPSDVVTGDSASNSYCDPFKSSGIPSNP